MRVGVPNRRRERCTYSCRGKEQKGGGEVRPRVETSGYYGVIKKDCLRLLPSGWPSNGKAR
jgi:hypothetical protein